MQFVHRQNHYGRRWAAAACVAAALLAAGCSSTREREIMGTPDGLYERASDALASRSYDEAIRIYEALEARYPFSDAARQSRLDLMYAYYRKGDKEQAVDAADTFIRENPTHPRIDYAYYVKGLVYFERDRNFLERWFDVDVATRPPAEGRQSFDAFSRVVTQYPRSEYAPDARQRMIYLRNRLADYEINVARYYIKRGAYVAAQARARYVIEQYDGAPAMRDALEVLVECYQRLGLTELAQDTAKVLAANFPERAKTLEKKSWWKVW
jgi:outer membrane protein assembly factor BamD